MTSNRTNWYVVQTQPNAESKAVAHLELQGFATYLPRYLKRRHHARRGDTVAAPLFPRYLFVAEHPIDFKAGALSKRDRFVEQMQLFDTATYLPDDILQKVDRASMAVSLDVRPPLLDHRVVEFAWRLPRRLRIRGGETKWLLRRVLDRYVPRDLVSRPKMDFGIPLASWLRGPLRAWAEDLLDPARFGGGLLDASAVRKLWTEHVSGHSNWAYALWTILMYEAWRCRWAAHGAASSV